jgi:hypothetical protein
MIQIVLIMLLSALAQFVLPWWSIAIVAFGVCFWRSTRGGQAFLSGFLGIAAVWLLYALLIHLRTEGAFTERMGLLLFKSESAALPLLVTVILGGLVGGLSGLTGFLIRRATNPIVSTPREA